jgi:hypothetical protein
VHAVERLYGRELSKPECSKSAARGKWSSERMSLALYNRRQKSNFSQLQRNLTHHITYIRPLTEEESSNIIHSLYTYLQMLTWESGFKLTSKATAALHLICLNVKSAPSYNIDNFSYTYVRDSCCSAMSGEVRLTANSSPGLFDTNETPMNVAAGQLAVLLPTRNVRVHIPVRERTLWQVSR